MATKIIFFSETANESELMFLDMMFMVLGFDN